MGKLINQEAQEHWQRLGDVPTDEDGNLDENFEMDGVTFEKGTDAHEVWHHFEEKYDLSVAEDLMVQGD